MKQVALAPLACMTTALLLCLGFAFAQSDDAQPDDNTKPAPANTAQPPGADEEEPAKKDDSTEDTEPTEEEEEKLPKLADMQLPTAEQLLRDPHRDWIILKTEEVIVTEPVYPRPGTLEKMQVKIDAYPSFKGIRTPEALTEYRDIFDELHQLYVVLPGDDDSPEYQLHIKYIAEIRHHEDLMLRRIDVFIDEGKYRDAFEMLFVLERSHPGWPGYVKRRERLLFLEAGKKFNDGKAEIALIALEELHSTNPRFQGLKNKLGDVTGRLIADAVADENYRRARHFLLRLKSREEAHSVVSNWTNKLLGESTAALTRSQESFAAGKLAAAVDAAEMAARIWPNMPDQPTTRNLNSVYNRVNNRYPRLRVGVVQQPRDAATEQTRFLKETGFAATAANNRRRFLTQTAMFEVEHSDDSPHFRSRLFEQWEPTDLGRRVRFTLRQNRSAWESQPVVTASSIMSSFAARLDPGNAMYDERLAGFVSSVAVISPFEFELQFHRVPARIESLLTFPVTREVFRPRAQDNTRFQHVTQLSSRRFELAMQTDDRVVYHRLISEPTDSYEFHVVEVIERLYPTYEKAVQGLLRGEVSMLPRVHSRDVPQLQDDERFEVVETALPVTHLIQFNPHSRVTRNRELRRALIFAINRRKILQETVLDDPDRARGRLVSGPFPTHGLSGNNRRVRGYAYNTKVTPRRYDPSLAAALSLAAGKHFGGKLPELRLLCVPDPIAIQAARQLVKHWGAAGIPVKLLTADDETIKADSAAWDIVYRIVRMTEPAVQLWPLLTLEPTARVESLAFLPDWLRQELIELDRVGDWKSAVAKLIDLHAHLAAEAVLIPLWELDDFVVYRNTIRGFPTPPLHPYQHIERWTVKPWLPNDSP
jgi:hypothetical protein